MNSIFLSEYLIESSPHWRLTSDKYTLKAQCIKLGNIGPVNK